MIAAWVLLAGALVHAHLVSSVPGDGESLAASPPVIRLVFSEPVEAGLSQIVVWSARDSLEIRVRADSTDAQTLVADVPHLAPAEYQVDWRVVSADGHPVEGSYRFTVLAPAGAPDSVPALGLPAVHRPAGGHAHASGPNLSAGVSAAAAASRAV